jgi:phosphopantothenoylcysteine decarboxylase / phosphopantothenate---cysteine ligase
MPLDPTPIPQEVRGLRVAMLIAGGVAAYKLVDLASALAQAGCEVRVAMTASATRFVGAPSFRGVTRNPVLTSLWHEGGEPEPHVALGDWAQVILLAPATANVIARVAGGLTNDIVTATLLAARCPVVVAPAMNDAMWSKPAVQENLATLRERGMAVVQPASGHLASGHSGEGRLADSAAILEAMAGAVRGRYDLAGRRVVVTAGGTREPIDPVRFIGNYSSGKMGYAIAAAAADRGARVTLIATVERHEHRGVETRMVETAAEMLEELRGAMAGADVLVMAAAVADFRPASHARHKIRREETPHLTLELESVPDLLAALAKDPASKGVYMVGFAAESGDLDARAMDKAKRKGLQAIVANDISRQDVGMGSDDNEGVMFFADGSRHDLPKSTKREMADRILDLIVPRLLQ